MDMSQALGPRRRILHSLTLDAIAAVDHPCQEHAKMMIVKRRPDAGKPASETEPSAGFADAVAKIAKRDRIGRADAMAKARVEHPDLFKAAYEKKRPAEAAPAGEDERGKARMAFMAAARGIAARDRIPVSTAMERARKERADLFDRAYS